MSDSAIKTLLLKGNLQSPCSIKLYPLSEYQQGRWNICIAQLIYDIKNNVEIEGRVIPAKEICSLTTNFVKSIQYSSTNQLTTVFQSLKVFILQGSKNDKRIVNFEKTWSLINNFNEELKVFVNNISDSLIFDELQCDFYIVVHLQRIK
jgi:RNA recognition motif-containing protein